MRRAGSRWPLPPVTYLQDLQRPTRSACVALARHFLAMLGIRSRHALAHSASIKHRPPRIVIRGSRNTAIVVLIRYAL